MAQNAANHITYYLLTGLEHKEHLAGIRQWQNLSAGFEEAYIWVKGFTPEQATAVETKSIPYKTLYYEKDGKLCLLHHLLPERPVPTVLWSPIERALPVTMPSFNHNFFGMKEKIMIVLIPSTGERQPVAMKIPLHELELYIETAPAWRLEKLRWTVINKQYALLTGNPLLPLNGAVYWQRNNLLLPAGYDLEHPALAETINKKYNPENDHWLVWEAGNTCMLLPKMLAQQLSRGSFRNTVQQNDITLPA